MDNKDIGTGHWNYRVERYSVKLNNKPIIGYRIVEAYYENGETIPDSITTRPVCLSYDADVGVDGIANDLDRIYEALSKPIIEQVDGKIIELPQ